ncbi:MAG: outer membrane protein assembly factor BamE [Haliea sp.]|nr:MAG: outer membrane protein assembly factor BamE [Haliea sp.]
MNNTFARRFLFIAATALLWQAGGGVRPSLIGEAQAQPAAVHSTDAANFPDPGSAFWKQGAFPSVEALRTMGTGMGKDQVRLLLGHPHFNEGLGGAREWNYLFHLRTGRGSDYVTCQYLVRFDEQMLSSGMYWKGKDCASYLRPVTLPAAAPLALAPAPAPAPAAPVAQVPPPSAPTPQRFTLAADGLFLFNGASEKDLLPEGRARVAQLAAEMMRNRTIQSVQVVGHTDRLGSEAYNLKLSQARAQTVRGLLVRHGVASQLITSRGAGESQPLSDCKGTRADAALIACLQPDRRVDIEVTGEK